MSEKPVTSPLLMDRSDPIGNSIDDSGRRALHARVSGSVAVKGLSTAGRVSVVTVNSAAWVALPSVPLVGRNSILIQNQGSRELFLNYSNTAPAGSGIIVASGAAKEALIADTVMVYGRVASGTLTVAVEELA